MRQLFADLDSGQWSTRLWIFISVWLGSGLVLTDVCLRGGAFAAEWSATPSLSTKGVYNSNLLLSTGKNEVWGYWITPAVKFKGATEVLEVEGETRADFVQYFGDQNREFTNVFFPLRTSYRADRHALAFEGGYTRDNTLMGELLTTGLVLAFTQRNVWTANPSWKMGLTERLSWQTGYHFTDTTYQDATRLGLADYQVHGGTTGPTYNLTEVDQLHLTGEYTFVRIPDRGLDNTYYGAQGGWTHDFGDGLIGSAAGGGRFIKSNQDIPGAGTFTSDQVVWVYNASLSKRFERTTVQVNGVRMINPSGFGLLLQTDRVGATLAHNVTETLTLTLSGGLYFVSGIASTPLSRQLQSTRLINVSPSLSWKFADRWEMDVAYTYTDRSIDATDQQHASHSTYLALRYVGYPWAVSR
jgi:hypothetical protein